MVINVRISIRTLLEVGKALDCCKIGCGYGLLHRDLSLQLPSIKGSFQDKKKIVIYPVKPVLKTTSPDVDLL